MSEVAQRREREHKRQALAVALRAHRPHLQAFVRARVPSSDVEDVLQAAALRALERSESLQDPASVLPWLYRLHRNIIVDRFRRQARRQRVVDEGAAIPEHAPFAEEDDSTCGCSVRLAGRMKANYASILQLVDQRGLTLAEAARSLGVSVNNATVRLHRARKALRQVMLEHCGVTSPRECAHCRCAYQGDG
ncbi:MAG: sigma-70 family RNA polymerase sigma factor [Myxococcales bacterium FL481]|nr:MAG: sigma-70 family RNA polymerase sigma factor [Myxococcales bacterium FL481]